MGDSKNFQKATPAYRQTSSGMLIKDFNDSDRAIILGALYTIQFKLESLRSRLLFERNLHSDEMDVILENLAKDTRETLALVRSHLSS